MPEKDPTKQIQRIHASGKQFVIAVTGGGSGAIAALLHVPGASSSVLEAVVPYAQTALASWLGGEPDSACSERTARAMAMAAFQRARMLSANDPRSLAGIGATASLVSARPKRGAHRVHVAWQSATSTVVLSCEFKKGARRREEEEHVATALILDLIAEAVGAQTPSLGADGIDEPLHRREQQAPTEWSELLLGERSILSFSPDSSSPTPGGSTGQVSPSRRIVFPGAFNPVHSGHERMAEIAVERCGLPITFELSITNVDKPPLDFLELDERLRGLAGRNLMVTRAPTFVEKARLLPKSTFVVGADTIERIASPRYYSDNITLRDKAVSSIAAADCRFLVFGRMDERRFVTLADLNLPATLLAICDEVPETAFRADVSSTQLRGAVPPANL